MPTRFLLVAGALAIAGLGIVVVQRLPAVLLSDVDRLAAHPEAQLTYPGAVPLYAGGNKTTKEATAARWQILGTTALPEEILAFYVGELTARGYVDGGPFGPTSSETMACSWHRELSVRISVFDPVAIRSRFKIGPEHTTVYSLRLIDRPGTVNPRPCSSLTECEPLAPRASPSTIPQVRCRILK